MLGAFSEKGFAQTTSEDNSGTTILSVSADGNTGLSVSPETGNVTEFINETEDVIHPGQDYFFLKIIQSTPNGEKVINILKGKLPQ